MFLSEGKYSEVSQYNIDELNSVLSLAFISSDQMYASPQVAEFAPSEVRPNQITFRWTLPPDEENGILLGFKIKYGIKVRIFDLHSLIISCPTLSMT